MADRGYIGIPEDESVTARYIHWAEAPQILIPTLRAIWAGLEYDSHRMAAALLAEDWSYLSAEQQQTGPYTIVPGVGRPCPGGTRPPARQNPAGRRHRRRHRLALCPRPGNRHGHRLRGNRPRSLAMPKHPQSGR